MNDRWIHRPNGGMTGCAEWWEKADQFDGNYTEIMFFTEEMHRAQPKIPQGWVYYSDVEGGWVNFPESCTNAEECMLYFDTLERMGHEL